MFETELALAIDLCMGRHGKHFRFECVRKWDAQTPYSVHPIWCAMTFLQETKLSGDAKIDREDCALALVLHDFKEETSLPLPAWLSTKTVELIDHMTISAEPGSTEIEIKGIWSKPLIVRLLKLYDKVSNLLDGSWMSDEKWNGQYVPYVMQLANDVEKNYGDLNIVRMARAVAMHRPN